MCLRENEFTLLGYDRIFIEQRLEKAAELLAERVSSEHELFYRVNMLRGPLCIVSFHL